MKNLTKMLTFCSIAVIGLGITNAKAQRSDFTAHHMVVEKPYAGYADQLMAEKKLELREYLDYESREQCQFYRPLPEGFMKQGCDIVPDVTAIQPAAGPAVLAQYEINFGFDSARLDPEAEMKLDKIANEIRRHNPFEVTVAGFTDKAGPSTYNAKLSQLRANTVAKALNRRGVNARSINREFYGEEYPEVPTEDGVALQENRRVEIQFME